MKSLNTLFVLFSLILLLLGCNLLHPQAKTGIACNNGQMSYNVNECGAKDIAVLPLQDIKDEFTILVKPELKINNFVSLTEEYKLQQSVKLDTSVFPVIKKGWRRLSHEQKLKVMENERILNRIQADSLHKLNNTNHLMVYIANNTNHSVTVQMQDWSFICVLEAQNADKVWKPIQFWQSSNCGNSYRPKHFAAKTANYFITQKVNTGNYKTLLRFKLLGDRSFYYSNTFTGRINYCQFYNDSSSNNSHLYALEKFINFIPRE